MKAIKLVKKLAKNILPYQAYYFIKSNPIRRHQKTKEWDKQWGEYYKNAINAGTRIFLLNTPTHTNIGDLAIAEAEIAFLKRMAPGEPIIEISALSKNIYGIDALKKYISKDALLLFHGGGYIHDCWLGGEEAFRRAVAMFPDNKIVLLPQSIFYSGSPKSKEVLNSSRRVYSRHKDLHLFARDKISYAYMKQFHPDTNVYLCPDIVLSMEYIVTDSVRSGVLLCMRSDFEKLFTSADISYIETICTKYGNVRYTDTIAADHEGEVEPQSRDPNIKAKLDQFSRASVVVTDRLHGMVFAAITGTPCVAVSNNNHKIKGVADWFKDLGYIKYIDDISEFNKAIETVTNHGPGKYDTGVYLPHFCDLANVIVKTVEDYSRG